MPIKRAAFKSMRQSEKHRRRNVAITTALKKAVKAVRKQVTLKDAKKAADVLRSAVKLLDRAAQKGVIKRNTAARLKSRLSTAVRKITVV